MSGETRRFPYTALGRAVSLKLGKLTGQRVVQRAPVTWASIAYDSGLFLPFGIFSLAECICSPGVDVNEMFAADQDPDVLPSGALWIADGLTEPMLCCRGQLSEMRQVAFQLLDCFLSWFPEAGYAGNVGTRALMERSLSLGAMQQGVVNIRSGGDSWRGEEQR
jgi:hypothetical protein